MFDYYFVSVTGKYSENLLLKLNANCLLSYLVDKRLLDKFIEHKKLGRWSGKLLVDNGAYTVWKKEGIIDIDKYLSFLNDNIDYIDLAIALDKIPGHYQHTKSYKDIIDAAEETYNNYLYMRDRIKDPNKLIPAFHQDEPFEYLERYLELDSVNYLCIAAHDMNTRYDWYNECFAVIKNSSKPDIKVHCLGNSIPDIVQDFPFTSIDASSWKLIGATGNIITSYGQVYVGTKYAIDTLPKNVLDEVMSKCIEYGIDDIYSLSEQYSSRAVYIMYELYHKSLTVNKTDREFKRKRRLF